MTKGIETFLNLPTMEHALREHGIHLDNAGPSDTLADDIPTLPAAPTQQTGIDQAMGRSAMLQNSDHGEKMEQLCREMLEHSRNLMDLGFNIEPPRARGIFEVATTMYGNVIAARTNKRDAELKTMKLILEQRKLELAERKLDQDAGATLPVATQDVVIVEDRNILIKRLLDQRKSNAE